MTPCAVLRRGVVCCGIWLCFVAVQVQLEDREQHALHLAQQQATGTQHLLQSCSASLQHTELLQQQLQEAIAAAHQQAEAAAAAHAAAAELDSQGIGSESPGPATNSQQQQQQQQQQEQEQEQVQQELPTFDALSARQQLQPLLEAEEAAALQHQQHLGCIQELKGQLAAAAARRGKYARLNAAHSSSSGGSNGGSVGSSVQHVCEQCLQPINLDLYNK
jgi:hypothetical protein